MKSPFTDKEMKRVYERRIWNFRGEQYVYEHMAWLCEDSGELFTDLMNVAELPMAMLRLRWID